MTSWFDSVRRVSILPIFDRFIGIENVDDHSRHSKRVEDARHDMSRRWGHCYRL